MHSPRAPHTPSPSTIHIRSHGIHTLMFHLINQSDVDNTMTYASIRELIIGFTHDKNIDSYMACQKTLHQRIHANTATPGTFKQQCLKPTSESCIYPRVAQLTAKFSLVLTKWTSLLATDWVLPSLLLQTEPSCPHKNEHPSSAHSNLGITQHIWRSQKSTSSSITLP